MDFFIRHRIEKEQSGNVLVLYVNQNQTEFSSELGTTESSTGSMQNVIQNYIDNNLPDLKVKTIKIMLGTLMLSSFAFMGGKVFAAPLESSSVKVGDKSRKNSYIVQPGDSLYGIAKKFSMTVEQIKQVNSLSSDVIQIGQVLNVPDTTPTIQGNSNEGQTSTYSVLAGDSLYLIAKKFNVSVSEIKQVNNLTTDFLQVGQQLSIPSLAASSMKQDTTSPAQSTTANTLYTVVAGDTLYSIAKKMNVGVSGIKEVNKLTTDFLQVGQQLTIPGSAGTSETQGTSTQIPAATQTETATPMYTVTAGDTLYSIAKKFNMSVGEIKQVNKLTTDFLQVGQQLTIPQMNGTQSPTSTKLETYTVVPGDSLSLIAKKTNSTVEDIKRINILTSDIIKVGQTLNVPSNNTTTPETNIAIKQLSDLGYLVDPSSASNGIKGFQNDYGLPVSGVLDVPTTTEIEHAIVKKALVQDSINFQGIPYLWGGTTTKGFDCSGFVYFMFQAHDISIGRSTSGNLYKMGKAISTDKLQPGDLVFFDVNNSGQVSHVGFYVGNNNFISATSSKGIAVVSMSNPYWSKYYMGAKRVY